MEDTERLLIAAGHAARAREGMIGHVLGAWEDRMSLLASDTLGCDLATLARLSVTPLPRAEDAERVLTDLAIYVGIDPMRLVRIMSETPEGKILVDRFHS